MHAAIVIALASALTLKSTASVAQWAYTAGEQHEQQQANFCQTRDDVAEMADVFERFGARTGFSALSASPRCATASRTFTPLKLEREVVMALQSGETYSIRFIQVRLASGETRYLVTTRDFDADP